MRRVLIATTAAALLCTARGSAQTTSDLQAWPSFAVTAPIGSRLEIRADGLLQVTDTVSQVGLELLRIVAVARLSGRASVGSGYTWTRFDGRARGRVIEHRGVQQFELRTGVVSFRTRLEERRQQSDGATAFRVRQQIRLDVPLTRRRTRAVAWSEYFHSLNTTAGTGRSGPGLVLSFVGLNFPVARRTTIEPGYLNQTNVISGPNRPQHAVAVFVATRLPQLSGGTP